MKKQYRLLCLGLFFIFLTSFTFIKVTSLESCPNDFENEDFKLSLCMEPEWEAEVKGPYIIISKDKIRISIYKEKVADKKSAESIGNEQLEKDLNSTIYRDLALVRKETMKVDKADAYLLMTHMPAISKDGLSQKEATFMTIYYNHAGYSFAINNNCYLSDCAENERMLLDLASRIMLSK